MKVLNIEVIDMYVERYSKENNLEVCLTTINGSYIATVNILGISDIEFWNEDYVLLEALYGLKATYTMYLLTK